MAKGLPGDLSPEKAVKNFVKAVGKGLQKVMSKMGISTYKLKESRFFSCHI